MLDIPKEIGYSTLDTLLKLRSVRCFNEKYNNGIWDVEQIKFIPIDELINLIYNAKFCVLPLESFNYSYGQMV